MKTIYDLAFRRIDAAEPKKEAVAAVLVPLFDDPQFNRITMTRLLQDDATRTHTEQSKQRNFALDLLFEL